MGRNSEILKFSRLIFDLLPTNILQCLNRQISTRYLVWHQNQGASTSESRDILRGNFHQRPNWPPDATGPHPRLAQARHQLKVMHAS